ncbi:MAG: DUF4177 domain-containing protein [Anaerococcus sp.]|uniref:DUF4177 domain-containing protein n=1 Tax=Anaerococcus TaxID=165779 RepID=UPI002900C5D0|nr:DUF4177 domain-containing protein [Anaerococcus sp.]MDU2353010.1 DUF4177 domain-containing protein [Anaerococcus sp.]
MDKFFKKNNDESNDKVKTDSGRYEKAIKGLDRAGEKFSNAMDMSTIVMDPSVYSRGGYGNFHYVVLQVTLKEKLFGTGSGNLTELEKVINNQAKKGYKLHTITTTSANSTGGLGGDRIQATMVFEKLEQ